MKIDNVIVLPILNQTCQTWEDFARIESFGELGGYDYGWSCRGDMEFTLAAGAYLQGSMVGFVEGIKLRDVDYVTLRTLYVQPDMQRRGIGSTLLGVFEDMAFARCNRVDVVSLKEAKEGFYINSNGYHVIKGGRLGKESDYKNATCPITYVTPRVFNSVMSVVDGVYKTPGMATKVVRDLTAAVNVNGCPAIGYWIGGNLAGFISGYKYEYDKKMARIRYLYVKRLYRKKLGIGRALIDEFGKAMKVSGVQRLRVEMALPTYNSAEFYKKCGFIQADNYAKFLVKTI